MMITRFEGTQADDQFNNDPMSTASVGQFKAGFFVYALVALAVIMFVVGFFAGEDGFGGNMRSDLYSYHEPTIWAFRNQPFLSVLPDYKSATTPLFHVLESFNPLLGHDAAFRATNTLFALFTCGLFIYAISLRFASISKARTSALLIGASILLSPYFRAESFWVSTDVLPVFLIIVTAILLKSIEDGDQRSQLPAKIWVLTPLLALVSWSCFYCRQTDLFVPFYVCLVLLWKFKTKWWWIVVVFGTLCVPALYLIHLWKGVTPPAFRRHQGFSPDALVQLFSVIFIYAIPFLFETILRIKKSGLRIGRFSFTCFYLLAGLAGFVALFHGFHFYAENRGGGIASKVLSRYGEPGRYLFLAISYLGFLVVLLLCRHASWKRRTLMVSFLLPTLVMTFVFQRYYDPVLLVLFMLLWERKSVNHFVTPRMGYLLIVFNAALLVGALVYYGRTAPIFLPLLSHPKPWTEVVLYS
jgi:hypothetical protein